MDSNYASVDFGNNSISEGLNDTNIINDDNENLINSNVLNDNIIINDEIKEV